MTLRLISLGHKGLLAGGSRGFFLNLPIRKIFTKILGITWTVFVRLLRWSEKKYPCYYRDSCLKGNIGSFWKCFWIWTSEYVTWILIGPRNHVYGRLQHVDTLSPVEWIGEGRSQRTEMMMYFNNFPNFLWYICR